MPGLVSLVILALAIVFAAIYTGICPSIYENMCGTRVYEDMAANIDKIMSAYICIHPVFVEGDSTSYSAGASGVVFAKPQAAAEEGSVQRKYGTGRNKYRWRNRYIWQV